LRDNPAYFDRQSLDGDSGFFSGGVHGLATTSTEKGAMGKGV
jgi:hypothetical protein